MPCERVVHLSQANTQSASKQEKSKPDNHDRFKPFCLVVFQHLQRPKSFARAKLGQKGEAMGTILLIILILLLIGALPAWPYSTGWGYWPSGGLGLILLIVIILALTGHV
jgi:hypothetical protein